MAITAGKVKERDTVLWFDPKLSAMGKFKVVAVYPHGRTVTLHLKSPTGSATKWSGPTTSVIQTPTQGD